MRNSIKLYLKKFLWRFPFLNNLISLFLKKVSKDDRRFRRSLEELFEGKTYSFIQVGSSDGKTNDPIYKFATLQNWKGVAIEPVQSPFERLKKNYRNFTNVTPKQFVVGPKGVVQFYFVKNEAKEELKGLPPWWDQLGSCDISHIEGHLDGMFSKYIGQIELEAVPLNNIVEEHLNGKIDLLHVDAEGFDDVVIETLDLSRFTPKVIIFEHVHLSADRLESLCKKLSLFRYSLQKFSYDMLCIRR